MSDQVLNIPPLNPKEKKLCIPADLFSTMEQVARACQVEIGMLGLLTQTEAGLVLTDLYIQHQVVGASHVQVDPDHIMDYQSKFVSDGLITPGCDDKFVRFAWHSHVDMDAIMSLPDRANFSALGGNGTKFDPPWWISMVMNRAGDYQIMYDQWQPMRLVADITTITELGNPRYARFDLMASIAKQVEEGPQTVIGGRPVKVRD